MTVISCQMVMRFLDEAGVAIIRPPYKIQNPSEPQNTPRSTPQILLQNTENTEKIYEKKKKIYIYIYIRNLIFLDSSAPLPGPWWGGVQLASS